MSDNSDNDATDGMEMDEKELLNEDELDEDSISDENDDSEDMDDEDDYEVEAKLMKTFIGILEEIDKDKYNYNNYVKLVDTAHEMSDLDKIRQSCDLFGSVYPLAPEIWLKRLKIELNIATTDAEYKKVHQLFKRALADYYSTSVAVEYANLAFKSSKANEIWEEIISTYALHCMNGRTLFDAWRAYIREKESDSPENNSKILQSYELELSIPLYDMEETYIELKVLAAKEKDKYPVDWERIDQKYNRAKEHLQRILPFEKRLVELDAKSHQNRAALYQEYIEESTGFLSDSIVQVLYERMITDCCLNAACWLNYIKYIQSRDGYRPPHPGSIEQPPVFSQTDWDIVNRAIRNCSWSPEIYVEKMRIAEKMELPRQDVQNVAEFALGAGFDRPEPLVIIWLEYLSYLRRNLDFSNERDCEVLRATFQLAWDSLGRQFGQLADVDCELLQMWGRLEYGPLNDFTKGKELWSTIMISGENASKSGLWIEFAHLEMKRGVDGARKVFRKALVTDVMDNIRVITSAWVRFERCNGTMDQLKVCQEQCRERLQMEVVVQGNNLNNSPSKGRFAGGKRKAFDHSTTTMGKKSNLHPNSKEINKKPVRKQKDVIVEPPMKRPKLENVAEIHDAQQIDQSKDNVMAFLSNLDYNVTEQDIKTAFPELKIVNVNIIQSKNGRSRGFGYVTLESETDVETILKFDRRPINNRPTYISSVLRDRAQRGQFKYSTQEEPTKLFIKGLPLDVTKEELSKLFGRFGNVKDIRLVFHKSGTPKGIGYVEYDNETAAKKAVQELESFELRDSKVTVAISAPPPKQSNKPAAAAATSSGLGAGRRSFKPPVQGDIKPKLSFIPRSVQQSVAKLNIDEKPQPSTEAPKTNADFRKLLNPK